MGFLKNIRSRSKLKNQSQQPSAQIYGYSRAPSHSGRQTAAGKLPSTVLDIIFSYVCPQTLDESYLSNEDSMVDEGCMLCHIRDLAHCALMNRAWAEAAQKRLYHSVRLDTIHYCDREFELSEKRKHRGKFDRNGEPPDPTQQRLKLFSDAVRSNNYLASLVWLLKMPYMTRESSKADLARTVSALPNLRFVDLPDGFFSEDASTNIIRQELQRCPDIRRMKYLAGAEGSFAYLAHSRMWQSLESVELKGLAVEADVLLYVLASFPALRNIELGGNMPALTDEILVNNKNLPPFPPVTRLSIWNAPHITAAGLVSYLSRPETREVLNSLELHTTGVLAYELHQILASATNLKHLSFYESITKAFPISPIPPLSSRSLENLALEILPEHHSANPISETYYNYLASSLLSGSLPVLKQCYAYSSSLPDLLFTPPMPSFGGFPSRFSTLSISSASIGSGLNHASPRPSTPRAVPMGVRSPLSLYTKSPAAPELEWSLTTIDPPSERNGRRGSASATRPLSLVLNERSASPATSVVGNGFGGFLAVPGQEADGLRSATASPVSSSFGHARKASRVGEWMG